MATNYEDRLRIPIDGDDHTRFETSTGLHVATGYTRVVIGGRGPYIEFGPKQICLVNLHVPEDKLDRLREPKRSYVYYFEWRSNDEANVKVYDQKRTVDYADYEVGMFYVSPFKLFVDGVPVITKLGKNKNEEDQYRLEF